MSALQDSFESPVTKKQQNINFKVMDGPTRPNAKSCTIFYLNFHKQFPLGKPATTRCQYIMLTHKIKQHKQILELTCISKAPKAVQDPSSEIEPTQNFKAA